MTNRSLMPHKCPVCGKRVKRPLAFCSKECEEYYIEIGKTMFRACQLKDVPRET